LRFLPAGGGSFSRLLALAALAALAFTTPFESAGAATQTQFSAADTAVQTAFIAVHNADAKGGNVSSLIAQLNEAIQMIQAAQALNATNPAGALADLGNATTLANEVAAAAPAVGDQGASAKQSQFDVSVGSAIAIVVIAAAIYAFGDRIYRGAWLRMYGGYVVRKIG
jgi:hypothetical protein